MTEQPPGGDPPGVGSIGAEAGKLFAALGDWAREHGSDYATTAGEAASSINEHIATGGAECTFCPVCQAISFVRTTSPEVRDHLTTSVVSLVAAGRGLLEAAAAYQHTDGGAAAKQQGVERIDLSEGEPWD